MKGRVGSPRFLQRLFFYAAREKYPIVNGGDVGVKELLDQQE